ncbi:hypothetical protein PR003_g5363 [Phytophthora rubi]|uniref:Uncharacterized protein n=1 Tax=Phytophthora rubi TaxID=129364 RepID=A0A6A4FJQ6_9STRA|nr:hypothetical protein PR001_g5144 [Phytophthora rubi]KAE9350461.1 hypothetical protein PR003_g5363 [Phytophthora rubi]
MREDEEAKVHGAGRQAAKTEVAELPEKGQCEAEQGTQAGWVTAGRKAQSRATTTERGRQGFGAGTMAQGQRERKRSPQKYQGQPRNKNTAKGKLSKAKRGPDQGDGELVFDQLKDYLQAGASHAYIKHTVLRLNALAKERRFKSYLNAIPTSEQTPGDEAALRLKWSDEAPARRQEQYKGLYSFWNMSAVEHQERLCMLMQQ